MGFWTSEKHAAVVGDGPIDVLMEAYEQMAQWRAASGEPAPPTKLWRQAIRQARTGGAGGGGDVDDDDLRIAKEALERLATEYRDSGLERDPSPEEVDANVDIAADELGRRAP